MGKDALYDILQTRIDFCLSAWLLFHPSFDVSVYGLGCKSRISVEA